MKYIKTYEENKIEYKVGDYILLKPIDQSMKPEARIVLITDNGLYMKKMYDIAGFSDNDELVDTYVYEDEIERFLTPEEIKEFDIKMDAISYNL